MRLAPNDILFVDTAPFIYFFERHPQHFPRVSALFDQVYATNAQVITSIVTYIELITQPARLGQPGIVRKYRDFLTHSENLALFPLDLDIADAAVALRAR